VIVVPDDFPSVFQGSAAHERAKALGDVRVFTERGADNQDELIRRIDNARIAINIRAHARFSEAVFAARPNLKLVSVWGTGTDNVDLNAAGMRGVTVSNTPGVNAFAVAEHALTLMLAVGRKITTLDREMRGNKWPREMLTQMLGKTLGVFGMGSIGARLATLGRAIGMDVLGWSAQGDQARIRAAGARPADKDDILRTADVVSLHVRLAPETRGFIGRKDLALMKPTAILVNTGRGALVERDALIAALREGRLLGAGLDVFHQEPLAADDPILGLPNVICSPHNAGQTPEVVRDGLLRAVQNVESFLKGKPTDVVVAPVK
jgi:D-3-phosphoglycerate dehydrogenase